MTRDRLLSAVFLAIGVAVFAFVAVGPLLGFGWIGAAVVQSLGPEITIGLAVLAILSGLGFWLARRRERVEEIRR